MPPEDEGPARKQGGQRGAAGKNRRQVDKPDEKASVEPGACTGCGAGLADVELLRVYRQQVFEASPPPPLRVIQYDVSGRVQWEPGLRDFRRERDGAQHPDRGEIPPGYPAWNNRSYWA